jgi:uncharacterized membrane protein YhiD involved in acid resistance
MSKENLFQLLMNGTDVFTFETIVFNIAISLVLSLFIFFVYKKTFRGVLYSHNFNVTIIMISLITAMVMMLIGSNLAISLGMVGALSIVRFRAAIKEPRDIAFLFWAITVGLAAGSGTFIIAIIGSITIAIILFIFGTTNYSDNTYLLVIKGNEIKAEMIQEVLKQFKVPNKLRMKNSNKFNTEITLEITLKRINVDILIDKFHELNNIEEVHMVSYNGEVSG